MNELPFEDIAGELDAIIKDGKVYVTTRTLLELTSALAQNALLFAPVRPDLIPGASWIITCVQGLANSLDNHFASELVPDSPEVLSP